MTTENPRAEKVAVVDEVSTKLTAADAAIITEYRGMSVGQLATLRRQLRKSGGEYKVYKNTLARFGAEKAGMEALAQLLIGPSAITFVSGDAAGVAKALKDAARFLEAEGRLVRVGDGLAVNGQKPRAWSRR